MPVSIIKEKQCFIVNFNGPLMASAHKMIVDIIAQAIEEKEESCGYVVINFSEVTLVTSVIMNAINQKSEDLKKSGMKLIIIAPGSEIFDVLKLTGFDRLFPVYQTIKDFKKNCNIK